MKAKRSDMLLVPVLSTSVNPIVVDWILLVAFSSTVDESGVLDVAEPF